MGTSLSRVPSKGSSRRSQLKKMVLDVDLNVPAVANYDEGPSFFLPTLHVVPNAPRVPPQLLPIDVDLIDDDDDILISSPRAFAEAKDKSNRSGRRIVDVDAEDSSSRNRNKRRRVQGNQQAVNYDSYVDLECESCSLKGDDCRPKEQMSQPPPPPKEFTFNCPVCMGPLVEEMSTKCGHIFCKACIKTAITVQKKCPTCRRKTTAKDIMRLYLPSAS